MKFKINCKILTIFFIITFTGSALGYIKASEEENIRNTAQTEYNTHLPVISDIEKSEKSTAKESSPIFIIQKVKNKLNLIEILPDGNKKIHESITVTEKVLPVSDKKELEKGIKCESLDSALIIIENYIE